MLQRFGQLARALDDATLQVDIRSFQLAAKITKQYEERARVCNQIDAILLFVLQCGFKFATERERKILQPRPGRKKIETFHCRLLVRLGLEQTLHRRVELGGAVVQRLGYRMRLRYGRFERRALSVLREPVLLRRNGGQRSNRLLKLGWPDFQVRYVRCKRSGVAL